jgi:hypothetical protein
MGEVGGVDMESMVVGAREGRSTCGTDGQAERESSETQVVQGSRGNRQRVTAEFFGAR